MNKLILEEIQRMNLLSKYDSSKTLNEQVTPELEIAKAIHTAASKITGTDEQGLIDAIKRITSPTQLKAVNDALISTWGGKGLEQVINGAFGFGDGENAKTITNHLKTKGIAATYTQEGARSMKANSFKITIVAVSPALPEWTKTFPCLVDRGTMKPSSNPKAVSFTNTNGEIYFFYDDKSFLYIYPDKKELKGTFGCVNNKLLINTDKDLQWSKDGGWQSIKTLKGVTVTPKTAVVIPPELKDKKAVMAFQDWLDINAKGWATGYKEGIINRGQNGRGYGTYGPRTIAAWGKYKTNYLTSSAKLTAAPVSKPEVEPSAQPPG